MANTTADFSKYLGNQLDTNIQDWAKIGKDISDDLQKKIDERKATRKNIDVKTQEAIKVINTVETGKDKTFNQFLMNGTGQTKDFLLMQERLLKKGVLKPQGYLNSRQVVVDDWNNLTAAAKSYNTDYSAAMERIKSQKAAGQEMYQNKKYDSFANIQDKSIFVNPVDGRLYITTHDEEGNINRDPASMINVNAINARQTDQIEKVNVAVEVSNSVGKLGGIIKAINADGVLTREDKRLMDITVDGEKTTFQEAKNDIIDSLMTSPRNNASILSDTIGGYTFTEMEYEAGGKVIYLKPDGLGLLQPELNEEQLKAVRDKLDMEIEKQLGFEETSTYATDVSAETARKNRALQRERLYKADADKNEKDGAITNLLGDLHYGNDQEIQDALDNLKGFNTSLGVITDITREIITDPNSPYKGKLGIIITTDKGNVTDFGLTGTAKDFVKGISSTFGLNFDDAIKNANLKSGGTLNEEKTSYLSGTVRQAETKTTKALRAYNDALNSATGSTAKQKAFAEKYGITVSTYSSGGYYLSKDGKNIPGKIDANEASLLEAIKAQIGEKEMLEALKIGKVTDPGVEVPELN